MAGFGIGGGRKKGSNKGILRARRERRRREAEARQKLRDALTPQEQLAKIEERPGCELPRGHDGYHAVLTWPRRAAAGVSGEPAEEAGDE